MAEKSDAGHIARETERYRAAAHRIQTAIAFAPDHADQEPKHLRVGVDLSKTDQAGLATLFIFKGVITREDYLTAIADAAEREAAAREDALSAHFGVNVVTR